jgi:FkbM family methyltransferase
MKSLAWKLVDGMLRWPSVRYRAAHWVSQLQFRLGVGAGTNPANSGETVAFELLRQSPGPSSRLCVFDVGANVGDYTSLALNALGGVQLEVHCFEPSPIAFASLSSRLRDRTGVHLNPFALGRTAGTRVLHSDTPGSGLASLTERRLDHVGLTHAHTDTVTVRTIDEYCAEKNIDRIDLLKIDVEGHELDVLEGARRLFNDRRVRLVTFEFGGCNIDTRTYVRDFWYFFEAAGARGLYRIMPGGRLFHIRRYEESVEAFRTTNFLVVLDDREAMKGLRA